MAEWRPEEDWDSRWDAWRLQPETRERRSLNRVDFEAGADAMQAALKDDVNSEWCPADVWIETVAATDEEGPIAGTWVFIPDAEGD